MISILRLDLMVIASASVYLRAHEFEITSDL